MGFSNPDKARRYDSARYEGAVGLNWWRCDPTLQFVLRQHMTPADFAWAQPRLEEVGALMGGPIARRAEQTDRNPPTLRRYDRWGHDVSEVVMPRSFLESKTDLLQSSFENPVALAAAREANVDLRAPAAAWSYMLNQAEIGMTCALGTGGDMVVRLVDSFAPDDVKRRVRELVGGGSFAGETAQLLTERTGGSDLAALECTAAPAGDAYLLNGLKWFASNANGAAYVVLAKIEGAEDGARGINSFLVLKERRDGSRNGVHIRQLKDKLGTKAVASGEVELVNAEAFLLAGPPSPSDRATGSGAGDGKGLSRMMEMTNGARLGIAMMGLGCARRALIEALCYARAREAFGALLSEQPLMQRKLAELIVDVEAAQALVFDGYLGPRLRIGAPIIKLFAARLGITAASDAIEIHGGNGYVEAWPVARILRDAQVNTIWEGPDNILCLDVRRGIEKESAHEALITRLRALVDEGTDTETHALAAFRIDDLEAAIAGWATLDRDIAEARLYPLSRLMADVYAAALLVHQAGWEQRTGGGDRKAVVAELFVRRHLGEQSRADAIANPDSKERERWKDLSDGALVDDRA